MREILFRAKRKDTGEWVEGYYVGITAENTHEKHSIISINNAIEFEVVPETVCEFTGLKDVDGKRIFEHDTVTVFSKYYNEWIKGQAEVSFSYEYVGGWVFKDLLSREYASLGIHTDIVRVNGSIFDTPELLN